MILKLCVVACMAGAARNFEPKWCALQSSHENHVYTSCLKYLRKKLLDLHGTNNYTNHAKRTAINA